MTSIAQTLGVPLDERALDRLMALCSLWLRYGRAMNLVGARDEASLLPHLGDGLATVACAQRCLPLTEQTRWLDVGSGGGFPALIVAAVTPCALTLVEPRQKRASFLELALGSIVDNGRVIRARADDVTWDENASEHERGRYKASFSVATSRAVFAPDAWLEFGEKLVMDGGVLLAHLRADVDALAGRARDAEIVWEGSRIGAFRVPLRR